MIRDFYLAIADKPEAAKYGPLRDDLNHHESIFDTTIKRLEDNFGKGYITLPDGKFDHRSSKIIQNLAIQANELMKLALQHIHKELQ